jgi:ABC-2 type transport system ATP-binding protein
VRFGELGECVQHEERSVAVRLRGGEDTLADIVRALDAEGIRLEHLQLHAPTLDDVFLAKTGRSLEGAGDEEEEERPGAATARAAAEASPA